MTYGVFRLESVAQCTTKILGRDRVKTQIFTIILIRSGFQFTRFPNFIVTYVWFDLERI